MPKLDGISATSLIRKFDAMTPIISMTSNSKPNEIMTYYSSGTFFLVCLGIDCSWSDRRVASVLCRHERYSSQAVHERGFIGHASSMENTSLHLSLSITS